MYIQLTLPQNQRSPYELQHLLHTAKSTASDSDVSLRTNLTVHNADM